MESEKVRRIVAERNLVPLANNTRWASLLAQLALQPVPARLKHIAWPEVSDFSVWVLPSPNFMEVTRAGPVLFREIEWLDFDCAERDGALGAYVAAAAEAKLTSEVLGQVVRVFGYRELL
jgi:hypothetical protein